MKKFNPIYLGMMALMMTMPAFANDGADQVWVATQQVAQSAHRIAIVPFAGDSQMSSMISANLATTQFGATDQRLPQGAVNASGVLANLSTWRNLGFDYVVVGQSHSITGNKTAINYSIIDTKSGQSLGGNLSQISDATVSAKKQAAAQISNKIYQAISGQAGDFGTKIAYVEQTGTTKNPISTLKLIDSDGQNARTLFSVTGSIFTPTFSPDGSRIAYAVQAKNGLPVIHLQSLNAQDSQVITPFWGHNLAPSFSPDGTSLLFSGSHENNNPNIYRLNLSLNTLERMTDSAGAENSPNYLPNAQGFIYTADQGTRTQSLYRYQFANKQSTRLVSGATNPRISRDGQKIAYVSGGRIVIVNAQGATQQSFAASGTDVIASFSPSANQIVYSLSQGNKSQLIIRSLHSNAMRVIPTTGIVRDPVWSN